MTKRTRTARRTARPRPLALAYVRVSTAEQADTGASLDAQRAALTAEAARRGWDVELIADEGLSGSTMTKRPGLRAALARLAAGEADALLAVRLDRVSRSVADLAALIGTANTEGWALVLLDPALDTASAAGKFTTHVLAAAAEYERDLIRARTREGMAQRKAEGVHIGRRSTLPESVASRIAAERAAGRTLQGIADALNAEGIPTGQGGAVWRPSSVASVLRRAEAVA